MFVISYWGKKSLPYKKSPPELMKLGEGVNTYVNAFDITKNEATESINTSDRYYPSLSTRLGTLLKYITDSNGVAGETSRAGVQTQLVLGSTWYYIVEPYTFFPIQTGLTSGLVKFIEFTTAAEKYTVMFNGTEKLAWDGTSVTDLSLDVNCPATRFITANDSRMFALKDSYIQASDIGDITNWSTGDADRILLTGMKGSGTSIIVYNDMIIAWSDKTMHVVFGKTKDDFDPTEPIPIGNVSDRSTIIHGQSGTLFWLDYNKFMAFTGGLPVEISQKVTKYLENINYDYKESICCGQFGKYIYISFPYGDSTVNNITLEYDTERGTWYPMDVGYIGFFNVNEQLIGTGTTGGMRILNIGTSDVSTAVSNPYDTPITWSHTTGVFESAPLKNLKHITDMYAIVDLPTDGTLTLSFSTSIDNDDFQTLHTFTADVDEQNTRIRIPTTKLQRVNWYRLKFSGVGPAKVHYLEVHGRRGE